MCVSNSFVFTDESLEIKHLISVDKKLASAINVIGNLEYSLYDDSFAFLVDTIIGQMLSNQVANVLSERMLNLCNGRVFPEAIKKLDILKIKSIGISQKKADYIYQLADKLLADTSFFNRLTHASDEKAIIELTSLHGIGNWSAKMYLIFVLNRQDILPFEDGAFLQAYRWLYQTELLSSKEVIQKCQIWKPYSSIAARYLYRVLDDGYVKKDISL